MIANPRPTNPIANLGKTSRKPTVLIVEDEPALADIYSTKFEMEGFHTLQGADGIEGLALALQHLPDLALPLKDGFEVLQDLKANPKTRGIPVIILSNLGQDYEVKRGLALGAARFLVKAAVDPNRIVAEVTDLLAKSGPAETGPTSVV